MTDPINPLPSALRAAHRVGSSLSFQGPPHTYGGMAEGHAGMGAGETPHGATRYGKGSDPALGLRVGVLVLSLFLSGFCGILAELSLFNLAETLLGGTNENLTYTMGFMMFAMGVGAAVTAHRRFGVGVVDTLILVELMISVLAMVSVVAIYTLTGWAGASWPRAGAWLIWTFSPLLGVMIGLEIPVVMRLNESMGLRLSPNAALVLAPDYFGALAAFVLFAFWLLPSLGLARAAWLGGALNLLVAGLVLWVFRKRLLHPVPITVAFALVLTGAVVLGWRMPELMENAEQLHYRDGVVLSEETPYQQIVITDRSRPGNPDYELPGTGITYKLLAEKRGVDQEGMDGTDVALVEVPPESSAIHPSRCGQDVRLYINGGLQFSTCDEHRYHEMLVHPARFLAEHPQQGGSKNTSLPPGGSFRALVLGGGDGMAVRELLKYPGGSVDLVELDETVVELFRDDPRFAPLNGDSLNDPRVRVIVGDAFRFLRESQRAYNVIVLDFPDPHRTATARLYSVQLFRFAGRALAPGGVLVTQSFSPLYHQAAFQVVRKTLSAAGFQVVSLQVPMLTFEHWGFHVASLDASAADMKARLDRFRAVVPTRYLNRAAVQAAHRWDKEMALDSAALPVNDQFTLPLLRIYTRGWDGP